jgi:hypothetical protein
MSTQLNLQEKALVRKIKTQMVIIGILTIIILGGIFIFFYKRSIVIPDVVKSVKFIKEVDDITAEEGTDNYKNVTRLTSIYESNGVLFTKKEMEDYFATKYDAIIARHTARQTQLGTAFPANYEWTIAFYWTIRNDAADASKKRLTFYVVPVLYNKKDNKVLDYFYTGNNKYYHHPSNDADPKNVYDEGQLWP